jgi:hypothetical protein
LPLGGPTGLLPPPWTPQRGGFAAMDGPGTAGRAIGAEGGAATVDGATSLGETGLGGEVRLPCMFYVKNSIPWRQSGVKRVRFQYQMGNTRGDVVQRAEALTTTRAGVRDTPPPLPISQSGPADMETRPTSVVHRAEALTTTRASSGRVSAARCPSCLLCNQVRRVWRQEQ